jgi:hypothetical protein
MLTYELGLILTLKTFEADEISQLTYDNELYPGEAAILHECVEKLQNLIASRSVRRAHPDLWNILPKEGGDE